MVNNYDEFYKLLTKKIKKYGYGWKLHITQKKNIILCDERLLIIPQHKNLLKPNGLWTSVLYKSNKKDLSWIEWLQTEIPDKIVPNNTKYFIIKYNYENILRIHSAKELKQFPNKYGYYSNISKYILIDWRSVAKEYKGIDISPVQKKLLHDKNFIWYSSWDCSSQCIWDFSAIKECLEIS